jgi:hypothetical protein
VDLSLDCLLKYKRTFVSKLILEPGVPWGSLSLVLQLLDQMQTFGVLKPFLVHNLQPIGYNEGKRKKGSFVFIFPGQCIRHDIVFALLVNDLIIISKELSEPFLLLLGGNALFQKVLEALMVGLNLGIVAPRDKDAIIPYDMQNRQHFFFINGFAQIRFQTVAC